MQIKKIVVPIDFSDYSVKALEYAVDFAQVFSAKLYLVSVIEPMIYPTDFGMGQITIPEIGTDLSEQTEKQLETLMQEKIAGKVEAEKIIRTGRPFLEIIDVASETDADLIIIATHGLTGVEHLLFGSTAEKVVRKAPCPVLTLREPIKGFRFKNQ
jgi:nucleotide-binding universal stress UspA family protein